MTCPNCQKQLTGSSLATLCPFCRAELPQPVFQSVWINWPTFFVVLFAPAIGCFLALTMDLGGMAVMLGLFGSPISGLICARMLMQGVNATGFKRSLVQFGLALILCGLTWLLCFLGCTGASMISNHGL